MTNKLQISTCHYTIVSLDKLVLAAIHKSLPLSPTQRSKAMPLCLWIFSLLCRETSDLGQHSLSLFPMATVTSSFHFSTLTQSSQRNFTLSSNSPTFRFRVGFSCHYLGVRASSYASKMVVRCSSSSVTGLFGSPLSEEKRVQLYTSFEHLLVLWELGCFHFLFLFSNFWSWKWSFNCRCMVVNFEVCFLNLFWKRIFKEGFVFLRIMLPLKVRLMRFGPSFVVLFVTSGCNS